MKCERLSPSAFIDLINLQNAPYSSSLATSASGSSTSVWSDASSQNSDDTSISAPFSDSDSCDSYTLAQTQQIPSQTSSSACKRITLANTWAKHQQQIQPQVEAPPELRQNARRTSISLISRSGCPPPLPRQNERKVNFVDNLVGKIINDSDASPQFPRSTFTSRFFDPDRRGRLAHLIGNLP